MTNFVKRLNLSSIVVLSYSSYWMQKFFDLELLEIHRVC